MMTNDNDQLSVVQPIQYNLAICIYVCMQCQPNVLGWLGIHFYFHSTLSKEPVPPAIEVILRCVINFSVGYNRILTEFDLIKP